MAFECRIQPDGEVMSKTAPDAQTLARSHYSCQGVGVGGGLWVTKLYGGSRSCRGPGDQLQGVVHSHGTWLQPWGCATRCSSIPDLLKDRRGFPEV